jgi:hypothetical protein
MEWEWWDCKHGGTVGNVEGVGGVWGTEAQADDDVGCVIELVPLHDWTCAKAAKHTTLAQK